MNISFFDKVRSQIKAFNINRVIRPNLVFFLILIGFLGFFCYLPLFLVLIDGFISDQLVFTLEFFLLRPTDLKIIQFTLFQAIVSTLVTLVIGLPAAYVFSRYIFPLKKWFLSLFTVPFVLPPIVVVLGFVLLFGPQGFINDFFFSLTLPFRLDLFENFWAVIAAHSFYNIPIVIRLVSSVWSQADPLLDEVADTLNSRGLHRFFRLTIHQIAPGVFASSFLTFIYCFTSFTIIIALGTYSFQTLELAIYRLVRNPFIENNLHIAAALVILQLVISIIFTLSYVRIMDKQISEKAGEVQKVSVENTKRMVPKIAILISIYFAFLSVLMLGPLLAVFIQSLINTKTNTLSFDGYFAIFQIEYNPFLGASPIQQIINTLLFSVLTMIIGTIFGLISGYLLKRSTFFSQHELLKRGMALLILLPMSISSITIGLGFLRLFKGTFFFQEGQALIIVIAHTLIAFPFVNRGITAAFEKVNPELLEVAETFSASKLRTFLRVELPIILPSLIATGIFAFAISLGEFGATYFLARPELTTMGIGVYQFLAKRQLQNSATMATLLIGLSLLSFVIIDKLGERAFT
ncbi:MAG: ABC transporter permease [Candidatus Hermodarchaeota archaeon]